MRSAPKEREELRARAEITSHFAAGPQARWRGASDELYPGRYVRSEQQSQRACGPQGRGGERASALLPLLDDVRHRLRRGASHLPARRSRQNVNLFLREPLVVGCFDPATIASQPSSTSASTWVAPPLWVIH